MNKPDKSLQHYLSNRRSIPAFQMSEPGPGRDEILAILKHASRVPDHGKLAPWRFIVWTGDRRRTISMALAAIAKADKPEMAPDMIKVEETRFMRAPVVIGVISRAAPHVKIPVWEQVMSAGAVCLNVLIAANAAGYVSNWLTEWMAYDARAHAILGVEPGERVPGFIHIGSSDFHPGDRPRPELSDIVTFVGDD